MCHPGQLLLLPGTPTGSAGTGQERVSSVWQHAQNVAPDGPISWMLWDITEMPLRWMDDNRTLLYSWGRQEADRDLCMSFGGSCFPLPGVYLQALSALTALVAQTRTTGMTPSTQLSMAGSFGQKLWVHAWLIQTGRLMDR
jgi:hypothetical protein